MADAPGGPVPGGVPDGFAVGGEVGLEGAAKLKSELNDLAFGAEKLKGEFRDGMISLAEFRWRLTELMDSYKKATDQAGISLLRGREVIEANEKTIAQLKEAQKHNKELTQAVSQVTGGMASLGTTLSATTGPELFKGLASNVGSFGKKLWEVSEKEVGMLGMAGRSAGAALGLTATAATTLVSIIDAAAEAQKGGIDVFLQMGLSAKDNNAAIREGTDAVLKAGTQYNLSQKEAGALAGSLSKAGIVMERTGPGFDRAAAATATYAGEVDTLAAAHKAYGAELGTLSQIGSTLGTRFELTGAQFDEQFGKMIKTGRASGAQMDYFLKTFSSVADAGKAYGTSIEQTTFATGKYIDELRTGALSLQNVINLTDAQSMSMDKQAALYALVNQELPEVAKKLKLTGDVTHDIFRAAEIRKGGTAEEKAALSDLPRQIAMAMAGRGGGTESDKMFMFNQGLQMFGIQVQNLDGVVDLYNNSTVKHADAAEVTKNASLKAKDATDAMKKDAEAAAGKYDGVSKQFNDAARTMSSAANTFWDAIYHGEATGGVKAAIQGYTGEGEAGYVTSAQAKTRAASALGEKRRDTGGLIPETGRYLLHAGERVSRAGSGGGISISVGGLSVSVAEGGDMKGSLREAMARLEAQILQKLEDQWQRATLAH